MTDLTGYGKSGSHRGLSPALWGQCPKAAILSGHLDKGYGFVDDFIGCSAGTTDQAVAVGAWVIANATAGTGSLTDRKGGWLELDSNSGTADQGVQAQRCLATDGGEVFIATAASKIYIEYRIELTDLGGLVAGNGAQLFFGLCPRAANVFSGGVMADDNYIGFVYDAADTGAVWQFEGAKANTTDSNTTASAIVDDATTDTRQKLGFVINGLTEAIPYVNGVALPAYKIPTAGIPIVNMAPTMACMSEGTVDPIAYVDYCACFQVETIDS